MADDLTPEERLLRAIFGHRTDEKVAREAADMCIDDTPCVVCTAIAERRDGAHTDWLRQQQAQALNDAADALEGGLGVEGIPQRLFEFRQWLRARADQVQSPAAGADQ